MQRLMFFIPCILLGFALQAQVFSIQGQVVDQQEEGLPSTTLLLLHAADSTMVNYALSDTRGRFEIRGVEPGNYLLRVTYVGFATLVLPVETPEESPLDMGQIRLTDELTLLREFILQEERIPMRVRGDTIEYDALAFRVQPNAVVEDLLRRMPGIEVQVDGSIIAHGEEVQRMLVDGREFFGRDPKMATQNLPAEAVSRVHVFDERSEQARFSGIDDGIRERTMNLELKEEHRNGMFGNASMGYGPENRYMGRANLNRFDPKGQLSLLGMANNLNQQGFSFADYMNFSGGAQGMQSSRISIGGTSGAGVPISADGRAGSNGIMTSMAGGVNMSRKFFGSSDITASYFYNQLDHDMTRDTDRENFMPGGNYDFKQYSELDNQNFNHRLNFRLDQRINENNSLLITTNASLNRTDSRQLSQSSTWSAAGLVQNTSEQENRSEGLQTNVNSSLLWRKRFGVPGRTLSARMEFRSNLNAREGMLDALNVFHRADGSDTQPIRQRNIQDRMNRTLGANLSYTEPLGNRMYLEANYQITQNRYELDQQVFDVDDQNRELLNPELTNLYDNQTLYQRGGFNYRLNRDVYGLTLGVTLQSTLLVGELINLDEEIRKDYLNILPVARFHYELGSNRRLTADYEASVREPSIQQLQPLLDNSDPLNLYIGNPGLRPAYNHRLMLRFNSFNPVSFLGLFANVSATYVSNPITHSVTLDDRLVRTISPVNTDSHLMLRGSMNFNFNLSKLRSRISVGGMLSRNQSTDIMNEVQQRITNHTLNTNVSYHFNPSDAFFAFLSAGLNQQITAYQFSSLEQNYLNQSYSAEINWHAFEQLRLNLSFHYQVYEGRTTAFDQRVPMLDVNISRQFLRNNSGELRLSGVNLLDRDLGVTQRTEANYLEHTITNSLGRYFLLTFTYSLNRNLNAFDQAPVRRGRRFFH